MRFSSEAKIGLIGIATLAVLIWGINFLKGRNVLKSTYSLHAFYSDSNGLESSAPVLINGIKIGYVNEVLFHPGEELPIEVSLSIEKAVPIQRGSRAVLHSTDLLGTKAIRIEASPGKQFLQDNDTIFSQLELDMMSTLQAQLQPAIKQISDLVVSLDTLAHGLDHLVDSETTRETMVHLSEISGSLNRSLSPGGSLDQSFRNLESFSSMLTGQEEDVASITHHLNSISQSVDSIGISNLADELMAVTHQFNLLLQQVNSGEGSAGKIIYADTLHEKLDMLISDLDKLIREVNENPQDFVHFSLFGNSQKEKK